MMLHRDGVAAKGCAANVAAERAALMAALQVTANGLLCRVCQPEVRRDRFAAMGSAAVLAAAICAVVVADKGCAAVWGSQWGCTIGVATDELHCDGWQWRAVLHWWQPMLHCRQQMGCTPMRVAAEGCTALEAAGAALVAAEELHCTGGS